MSGKTTVDTREALEEFARAVAEGGHVDNLPPSRFKDEALELGEMVTSSIDFLRSTFPNEDIRRLMALTWDAVGQGITPASLGPVKTCSFVVVSGPMGPKATIMFPEGWVDLLHSDRLMQMGALVFTGSQSVDFRNSRLIGQQKDVQKRAFAFEAESLLTSLEVWPTARLNDYQRKVLADFPLGLASLRHALRYREGMTGQHRKPAAPARGPGDPHVH